VVERHAMHSGAKSRRNKDYYFSGALKKLGVKFDNAQYGAYMNKIKILLLFFLK